MISWSEKDCSFVCGVPHCAAAWHVQFFHGELKGRGLYESFGCNDESRREASRCDYSGFLTQRGDESFKPLRCRLGFFVSLLPFQTKSTGATRPHTNLFKVPLSLNHKNLAKLKEFKQTDCVRFWNEGSADGLHRLEQCPKGGPTPSNEAS